MSKEEVAACKAKPAFRVMSEKEKIEINCNTKKYRVLVHVFFKQNMAGTVGKEYLPSLNNPSVFPTSHADKLVLDTITEEFCLPEGKAVKPAPGKKK